ncbi:thioesterase family protein [Roseibium aquae]|nr:thioesterase family protein [Roseibium aquae]
MNALETLFSFVNPWECDENNHSNVQFYFSRFEEADRQFQLLSGLSETLVGSRRVRHVRYHRELRVADLITVTSHIAFDGPHMLTVVHEMRNGANGTLAATATDGYEPSISALKTLQSRLKAFQDPMPEEAAPRGLAVSPYSQRPTPAALVEAGARVCFRGTVLARHLGPGNKADDKFAIACFTDGVAHVWERTPMTHAYLTENGYGRVAVEMKLTWISPLKAGDPVKVISGLTGVADKTFTMRHHLFEARTERLAAVCDVVALVMDLKKRGAVALPDTARKQISGLLID